ncbi:NAD(P)/FAD-dependent oxidoreductase [Nonomuraea glycinis]|uniref:Oxidoreductase n=1 Tax=Nonomuraea glycinis TaxID=2047744 RepID=A0A918A4K2_9ACTN|nr:NAD(P)/FAD-dependent oxidoreductase [Nonomuraea glycinis]MCA2176367.1 NAD(P)/FAD-dependent oxidoreductase [Nonomuraea glycinis]GGP07313.1 oxidoreductase [Nonomuraea glycinis]
MIDVLVAGGGPAGLATAIHAALAGMEAVVVEPRATPVDKACGEGVMPGGVAALAAMGVTVPGHPLRGIHYLDARREARATFHRATGLGVRRTLLHAALAQRAAELGVKTITGRITEVAQDGDGVRAAGLRARWLVAADGLHSPLRRSLGLDLPARGVRRYGQRRHYRMTPWTDFVEVHWSGGGEAYVTPVGHDLVGVAILSSGRRGFEEHLSAFPGLVERLRGPAVTPVRGAGPLRQHVRARRSGRVLLVGDAAGYVDALTGEGISLAVRSAEILIRCLREDRPQDYEGAWLRLSRTHRLLTGALVQAARRPGTARLVVPAARALPRLFTSIVRMLA